MSDLGHDSLQPHRHDPNPKPPHADPAFLLRRPDGTQMTMSPADLMELPQTSVPDCYIVSTGHGTSGPFTFTGTQLRHLVEANVSEPWSQLEVVSADGFGNRVYREEVLEPSPSGPILLAYAANGAPLTREDGLIRLIVPAERDDALRQVKWVAEVRVLPP